MESNNVVVSKDSKRKIYNEFLKEFDGCNRNKHYQQMNKIFTEIDMLIMIMPHI